MTLTRLALTLILWHVGFALAQADYRASPQSKLAAAKRHVQSLLDADAAPKRGFYDRDVSFPVWKDQAHWSCASQVIVRAIQPQDAYFEDPRQQVAVVPVWAELLLVRASQGGGPLAASDGSKSSQCAFEYERWSFERKRFEKIDGFRHRTHFDEFPRWGEGVIEHELSRWVAIDRNKRYVRFLVRVHVTRDAPYQLPPQFPMHFPAEHSLRIFQYSNQIRIDLLAQGKSDRDERANGQDLADDLVRMQRQLTNSSWAADRLRRALEELKDTKPFEEITERE